MSEAQVTESAVIRALSQVKDPELGRDLVSLGMIKDLSIDGSRVEFTVVLTTPACPLKNEIQRMAREAVLAVPGVSEAEVNMGAQVASHSGLPEKKQIPGVKNVIAVSSGKGGVGKSTVSVNLALALSQTGAKVGLLDADITGPNIPLMMGIDERPQMHGDRMGALSKFDIQVMSIGFLLPEGAPVLWRAPMMNRALTQFLYDVEWGELDYLVVDLPPGTGDIVLTLAQTIPLAGAVIVTTPQDVALQDGVRALSMFDKMGVPILGIVENMSFFVCPHCNERTEIFSHGGGRYASETLEVPFLGEVPLDPRIRYGGDMGLPVTVVDPESPQAEAFHKIAVAVAAGISMVNLGSEEPETVEVEAP